MQIKFRRELLAVTITLVGTVWLFMHNDGSGINSAAIFQGGSGSSTIEVRRSNGLIIIERRDRSGNSATIVQQDQEKDSSN
jgi:hypothetical protein